MNKPLVLGIIFLFVVLGFFVKWATKDDRNKILRAYPYVIWTLCWLLYNIIPFC